MTIGKLYYLASVLGGLKSVLIAMVVMSGSIIATVGIVSFIEDDYIFDFDSEITTYAKKHLKALCLTFLLAGLLTVLIPSKEDFLVIALTKDYRPEQVYNMSKDELKSGIDYAIEKLKEVDKK